MLVISDKSSMGWQGSSSRHHDMVVERVLLALGMAVVLSSFLIAGWGPGAHWVILRAVLAGIGVSAIAFVAARLGAARAVSRQLPAEPPYPINDLGAGFELIRSLSGAMRTSLATIAARCAVLADLLDDIPAPRRQAMAIQAMKDAHELRLMIDEVLELTDVHETQPPESDEPCHLETEIRNALALLGDQIADRRVKTHIPSHLGVRCDPRLLRRVLDSLITRAGWTSPAGCLILIRAREAGQAVVVSVDDDAGPETEVESRPDAAAVRAKSELALGLAKRLVDRMGGTLTVEPAPRRGTTVSFSLPTAHKAFATRKSAEVKLEVHFGAEDSEPRLPADL